MQRVARLTKPLVCQLVRDDTAHTLALLTGSLPGSITVKDMRDVQANCQTQHSRALQKVQRNFHTLWSCVTRNATRSWICVHDDALGSATHLLVIDEQVHLAVCHQTPVSTWQRKEGERLSATQRRRHCTCACRRTVCRPDQQRGSASSFAVADCATRQLLLHYWHSVQLTSSPWRPWLRQEHGPSAITARM
jgi:hypothetical protein